MTPLIDAASRGKLRHQTIFTSVPLARQQQPVDVTLTPRTTQLYAAEGRQVAVTPVGIHGRSANIPMTAMA